MNQNFHYVKSGNAYLTVYLALVLSVLLSLAIALIEGARSGGIRLEAECVTDVGLNSILAEYHRELFRQYGLFAIDSSYGGSAKKENVDGHLRHYLTENLSMQDAFLSGQLYRDFMGMYLGDAKLTRVSLLTDDRGDVFRRQAVEAIQGDMGIALAEELAGWLETVDAHDLDSRDVTAEKRELEESIQEMVECAETETSFENPTQDLEAVRGGGILKRVVADPTELSHRVLQQDSLIQNRLRQGNVNQGNLALPGASEEEAFPERILFQEYLFRYLGNYREEKEQGALRYQVEYLISGKAGDVENLQCVADRLCFLREAANVVYLLTDTEKCAEAEILADVLSTAILLPEIAPLVKMVILFGWAYAESVYDVETLLAGGKIPLIKDDSTWHYSLSAAFRLSDHGRGQESKGLAYEDYLRIFMALTDLEVLTARAMDMVEADLRYTPGNANFRLDGCYVGVEADVRIMSSYGYDVQVVRQKYY